MNEQTKNIMSNPLIKYCKNNNLIITPHIAGLSMDSESKAAIAATEMLKSIKMKYPEISVIISNYNHEQWIDRCIRSLSSQNNLKTDDYEIIVTDDCSLITL